MASHTSIYSVANTIRKFHIQSNSHTAYKHNFYHDKKEIIDELFCQHIEPLLKDINHPALIQEQKQNLDAAAYEIILNEEVKILSKSKEIDNHDSQSYRPTSIIEEIQWFPFLTIMEHTADNIENYITLLPLLLKLFTIFNMRMWYDNENLEENVLDNIGIRCSNSERNLVYM